MSVFCKGCDKIWNEGLTVIELQINDGEDQKTCYCQPVVVTVMRRLWYYKIKIGFQWKFSKELNSVSQISSNRRLPWGDLHLQMFCKFPLHSIKSRLSYLHFWRTKFNANTNIIQFPSWSNNTVLSGDRGNTWNRSEKFQHFSHSPHTRLGW